MPLPELVSSNAICRSLDISKRTLQRRFHCEVNPLPEPSIKRVGGMSMWDEEIILEWLERERERTRLQILNRNDGELL